MQIAVRHNALPSSLVAGMCSVCVVASVGAAAPLPAPHSVQAAHSAVATVSTYAEKYYLTAFPEDLLQLVSLPFTAYQTFLNNLIAGPNEFIKAINTLNAAIYAQTVGPFVAHLIQGPNAIITGLNNINKAIVGQVSPQEGLDNAQTEMNSLLTKLQRNR